MVGPLEHPLLGPLDWDDQLAWWVGKVTLKLGNPVEIFISGEGDPPEAVLTRVPTWLERIQRAELQYRQWTAEQIINGRWNLEEDMTLEEITALLRLASISFDSDGETSLCWDDQGRLFSEHGLITDLDTTGKCTRVWIAG
jgi:hypothetical protein